MLNTSQRSNNQDGTLRAVESQINILTSVLESGARMLRFPGRVEKEYLEYRNQQFLDIDIKIIAAGLVVYLLFSWSDFSLGGERGSEIFTYRLAITICLFALMLWLPNSRLRSYVVPLTAVGITLVGTSVICFIYMLEGLARYAYHLGLIPIQVFAMVSLRLSYRSFLISSMSMLTIYGLVITFADIGEDVTEIGQVIMSLQPYFMTFWFVLIAMGGYLAFVMESAFRSEYMKNRLLALEAERLQYLTKRLQLLSTTDGLTSIANRRHFEYRFDVEWRRCQRAQVPVAIVMIDIDAFKEYNDGYGHQKGDECLRAVAAVIAQACRRPGDLCARYGGEEFVLLLPDTAEEDAVDIAEKARIAVEKLAIPHNTSDGIVTTSAGVAAHIPLLDESGEALIRHADHLLYNAKHAGRNRVHWSGEP